MSVLHVERTPVVYHVDKGNLLFMLASNLKGVYKCQAYYIICTVKGRVIYFVDLLSS